jgi:cytochrome P450
MTGFTTDNRPITTASTWPVLGCLPGLIWRNKAFWSDARRTHGDIYRLDLGVTDIVVLGHPRHAQHVLVDNAGNYLDKGGPTGFRATLLPLTGQGLSTIDVEDEKWRQRRDLFAPVFRHAALKTMTDHMARLIDKRMDHWPSAVPRTTPAALNVMPQVTRIVMTVLAELLYGGSIRADEIDRVSQSFHRIMNYMWIGMLGSGIPAWLPFPGRRRQRQAIQTIEEVVLDVIARRSRDSTPRGQDLLDVLTAAGRELDTGQVRDEAISLLLGAEPLAISVSWALHLLAQSPQEQRTAYREVANALGDQRPRFEDLSAMPYIRMVFKEALRLCPPTYWVQRRARDDDVIDGVPVPSGTVVVVMIHQIHVNPDVWENPLYFDPQRFTPKRSALRHRQAWIPFGSGRRGCVAKDAGTIDHRPDTPAL